MNFAQGDIVLVPFPFSNQGGSKARPAIVVSNSSVNKSKDILLAQITSSLRNDGYTYILENKMLSSPLIERSCEIRCHKLFIAEKSIVLKKISTLKKVFQEDLINKIIGFVKFEE